MIYRKNLSSYISYFFRRIRKIITASSHLSSYIPYISQSIQNRKKRIVEDKSHVNLQNIIQIQKQHSIVNQSKLLSWLSSSRPCWNPTTNYLLIWYVFVLLGIIYYFFQGGIMIAYGTQAWISQLNSPLTLFFNLFFVLIFIGDIWIQMNCGYIVRGSIVLVRLRVMTRYLRSFFIWDLLWCIILIITPASNIYELNFVKIMVFYKFIRMFEIDKIYLRRLSVFRTKKAIYVILKQIVTIFILSHIIGIIFYLIDLSLLNGEQCSSNSSLCWLNSATAFSPIISLKWSLRYFYSLYWGINTICTISYGDIAPNNPIQTTYATFCMCLGFVVYGYVVNNIIKAVLQMRQSTDEYRSQVILFDSYMGLLKIPKQIQINVIDFLYDRHKKEVRRNSILQQSMKSQLPQDLRVQLVCDAYNKVYQGLKLIIGSNGRLVNLLYHIKEKKYGSNEVIITQGAPLRQLYYMLKGSIQIKIKFGKNQFHLTSIDTIDQFVCHYQFFLNIRASYSVITNKDSIFYYISQTVFDQQIQNNLQFKELLHMLEYQLRFKSINQKIFFKCLNCKQTHKWQSCPQLFPIFDKQSLVNQIDKYMQGKMRVINTKHHAWKDFKKLKGLQRVAIRNKDRILGKLQKRLINLKQRLETRRIQTFQVDNAYDWPNYLKQQNLAKCKQILNNKRRMSTYTGISPKSPVRQFY